MRNVTISTLAVLLIACGGAEAPQPETDTTVFEIVPNYRVIAEASEIVISAVQEGEGFTGRFAEFDAQIDFDADDLPGSQVRVRIPLSGLDLGSADRNDAFPSKTWFNTRLHPVATFASDQITANDEEGAEGGYVAEGYLTMKGLRRPIRLPFTLTETAGRTVMQGSVEIDRTAWNLGESPWDTEEYVGHSVTIDVTVTAERL